MYIEGIQHVNEKGVRKNPECSAHGMRLRVQGVQLPRLESQLPYTLISM